MAHGASLIVPATEAGGGADLWGEDRLPDGGIVRLNTVARLHLSDLQRRVVPATHRQRRYDLESFVAHVGGEVAIRAVKHKHVQAWVDAQDCSPATLKVRFLSVRMMFRFAQERRWVQRSPCEDIILPRVPRRQRRALNLDQLRALGAVLPDDRDRRARNRRDHGNDADDGRARHGLLPNGCGHRDHLHRAR